MMNPVGLNIMHFFLFQKKILKKKTQLLAKNYEKVVEKQTGLWYNKEKC